MNYGYCRVSTIGQKQGTSLQEQMEALKNYGCDEIVTEAYTGKTMDRPEFNKLLARLQPGDTLVACRLDRFARNTISGIETIQDLFNRNINVEILNMGRIDDSPMGRLVLTVLLSFATYERELIIERTNLGKQRAKEMKGASYHEGRPKKYRPEQMQHALDLLNQGYSLAQVERLTRISKATLCRAKKHQLQ